MDDGWMDVGGCIWVWVDVGGMLGGLEEDWRRVAGAGALEEDGPPKYGLGTPQYGLGTPQYGDYVATSWKNDIFLPK